MEELILCGCGCGQKVHSRDRWGRTIKYVKNHYFRIARFDHTRANNGRWKGGRKKSQQGYIQIKMSKHPFCDKNCYVFEHRLVMEKHIGRYLKAGERIHHINGNRQDNRIKNLKLFINESYHKKEHWLSESYRENFIRFARSRKRERNKLGQFV